MAIDFKAFNDALLEYFAAELTTRIAAWTPTGYTMPTPKFYEDIPNFDVHGEPLVFYQVLNEYSFDWLSTESEEMTAEVDCFFTVRGITGCGKDQLDEISKGLMTEFYDLIEDDRSLGGIVDSAHIARMTRYDAAEGFESARAIAITLQVEVEV